MSISEKFKLFSTKITKIIIYIIDKILKFYLKRKKDIIGIRVFAVILFFFFFNNKCIYL